LLLPVLLVPFVRRFSGISDRENTVLQAVDTINTPEWRPRLPRNNEEVTEARLGSDYGPQGVYSGGGGEGPRSQRD
jgi:hypothetical protein